MFFLSLLVMLIFSTGIILYTGPVPVARGGLPADDPGLARPDLRLQVLRGDRLFELGVPAAGQPADGLLRDRRGRLVGVLRDLPGLLPGVRADPREPGGGRRRSWWRRSCRGGRRRSWALGVGAAGRWAWSSFGLPDLADARRRPDDRLARRPARPARVQPAPALAEPMDVGRAWSPRSGATGRPACSTSAVVVGPRRPGLPARGGRRPRPLPARLRPGPGRAVVAAADRLVRPRRRLPPGLLLPAQRRSGS